MTGVLGFAASCEVALHLDMPSLLRFCVCDRSVQCITTKVADDRMRAMFAGVRPLAGSDDRRPFWRSIVDASRPNILHASYCWRTPDCTRLVNMVLDTAGSWFLEFEVRAADTMNGMPCVGIVDASTELSIMQRESGKVCQDLSQEKGGKLAISFNAACGKVFLPEDIGNEYVCVELDACRKNKFRLKMEGYSSRRDPIKVGVLIINRRLTFFRGDRQGEWCCSGFTFCDLPEQVIPAVFLSSFVGYASARFLHLWSSPPWMCGQGCCQSERGDAWLSDCSDDEL